MRHLNFWYKIFVFALFMTIILAITIAQAAEQTQINIQAGILHFPKPDAGPNILTDISFAVNRNQFQFIPMDSTAPGVRASIFAEVIIMDTLGNRLDSARTYFYSMAEDSADAARSDIRIFNKIFLMLPPGIYKGSLTVLDVASKREGKFIFDRIEVPSLLSNKLLFSSLEFAFNISIPQDTIQALQSRLYKNGKIILPNPMAIYSANDTMIHLYVELYNLKYDGAVPEKFEVSYKIINEDGTLKYDYGKMLLDKPGMTSIITSSLNISDIGHGKYNLAISAFDPQSGQTAELSKRFIIVPTGGFRQEFASAKYINPLDTAGLKLITNLTKYLFSAQDYTFFKVLNDTGKTRFIRQFFGAKDPTPTTAYNEYLEDALSRYNYANEHFSRIPKSKKDGWQSDRGRVLIQYGQCDYLDEEIVPELKRPYEIWYYHSLQGGVYFIFVDKDGTGDYRLVHSTAMGEIYDKNWEGWLQKGKNEIIFESDGD
jgi:GWxTD domain-containing protein